MFDFIFNFSFEFERDIFIKKNLKENLNFENKNITKHHKFILKLIKEKHFLL